MSVLLLMSCGSSRTLTREVHDSRLTVQGFEQRDSVRTERVEVLDTLKEITTITVQLGEAGDTVKVSTVTDRLRARERSSRNRALYRTEVVRDTVFIEKRDSVSTTTNLSGETKKRSTLIGALKWVFFIIVGLIVLVIVFRFNIKK